jgi:DNA polymerase-3 subunit delta'
MESMSWQGIEGHDDVVAALEARHARGRLAGAMLFVGPAGVGKRTLALKVAQALLCPHAAAGRLAPCGACPSCVQAAALTHPDLELVRKPADKSTLPIELLIGPQERRMQEGLCHNLSLRPMMGGRKVAVIDDADYLAQEGANALLKTLEEPPPRSLLILIGTSPDKQLPTIRSRVQLVRFRPLPTDVVARLLLAEGIAADQATAERLARHSEGSLAQAAELADDALWTFREQLWEALAQERLDGRRLAAEVAALVEGAGREAPARRARMRQAARMAADYYRALVRRLCGAAASEDVELTRAVGRTAAHWTGGADRASECLQRCLEALEQVDRNANTNALIDAWTDDLAHMGRPVAVGR